MTLVKWSPLKEFEDMRRDMENLFGNTLEPFGRRRWLIPKTAEPGVIVPKVDMYDKKNEVVIRAEIPGVKKENVDLTITKDSLTIKGETKKEEETKGKDFYCSECSYGSFLRTLPLPAEIDTGKAKAVFKNGVLTVTLPKHEAAKTKEVKVKVD
jgi:HSP20 family protein